MVFQLKLYGRRKANPFACCEQTNPLAKGDFLLYNFYMAKCRYDILNIIDLEATCGDEIKKLNVDEIIEIGITQINRNSKKVIKSKSFLVKPSLSWVTPFCTELTGHTQEELDTYGMSFADACLSIEDEFETKTYGWAAWGNYDMIMLTKQCRKFHVDYPMSPSFMNIAMLFSVLTGRAKAPGLAKACKLMNIEMEGRHHNGKDDSYNTAKILLQLIKDCPLGSKY